MFYCWLHHGHICLFTLSKGTVHARGLSAIHGKNYKLSTSIGRLLEVAALFPRNFSFGFLEALVYQNVSDHV